MADILNDISLLTTNQIKQDQNPKYDDTKTEHDMKYPRSGFANDVHQRSYFSNIHESRPIEGSSGKTQ